MEGAYLFPVDRSPCLVLPVSVSQLLPFCDHLTIRVRQNFASVLETDYRSESNSPHIATIKVDFFRHEIIRYGN